MKRIALFLPLLCLAAAPASAKSYSAERYDSTIQVLPDGGLEVTETVVFRFEQGTFTYVFREIPRRRTDEIEIVRATMDERVLPFGKGRGLVDVGGAGRSSVRVRWEFEPVADSTHVFSVIYRVRGVVHPVDGGEMLRWHALPTRHDYRIERSTIEVRHAGTLAAVPEVSTRRVDDVRLEEGGQTVTIVARGIRKDGHVEATLLFTPGSVASAPPAWWLARQRANALAPSWAAAAAAVGIAGLLIVWTIRQRYDAPPRHDMPSSEVATAPDSLSPAVAGVVSANGRISIEHAMAALFEMADRGEIEIREEPKGLFGQRRFTLVRRGGGRPSSLHEQEALEIAFRNKDREESSAGLDKARARLGRHFARFKSAIREEMASAGLIDRERLRVHSRLGAVSLTLLLLAAGLGVVCGFLASQYRGWPVLIPAAVVVAAITGFIVQASTTPLSNEGVRRRERWRAYQKHLEHVAAEKLHLTSESPVRILPIVVALGLASAWAKFVKKHPGLVPDWFHAIAEGPDGSAFSAMIAAGGSPSSGGGGGGGGAGGGASGAG